MQLTQTPKTDAEIQGHGLLRTENRCQLQVQPAISELVDQCCTRPVFQLKPAEFLAGPAMFAEFTSHNQNHPMEGGSITPPIKIQVMRLALYLDSIQQTPNVSGDNYREYVVNLTRQFQQLSAEQREDAKRLGRMRIRECGDLNAAASHLVPVPAKKIRQELALQKRREKASRWPPETPACPRCKVRGYGIPKRSWPSQEMAEAVRFSL